MQRINPNSSIRSGYKFEDLYALKLCFDWLTNPESLQKIQIQYKPDEVQKSRFSIDDVVTINSKDLYGFYQLKYKQHPQKDLWTLQELLDKGLIRWIDSFNNVRTKGHVGYFITNGHSHSDILSCLVDGKVLYSKLKKTFPEFVKQLLKQTTLPKLKNFFSNFNFLFAHPGKHDFEKQIRQRFYDELKATKDGVNNLLLYIVEQGSEQYPRAFALPEIRSLLSWDNPRPLNQNFDIPSDFEFFDKKQHELLIRQLQDPKGGMHVIIGKPGAGKSTYLSKLFDLLHTKLSVPIARHHYHLNPNDNSSRERLNADRVREALRAEFKKYKEETIGELSYQNTEHIPLREFIKKIAAYYYSRNASFILIIDGLDHVIREGKNEEELRDFLDEVLYPQPGFQILFGTQEMAIPYFPNVIFKECPRNKWIEIKGLNKEDVKKVIHKHADDLRLPNLPELQEEIIEALYKKCAGNPLHLRYVLTQLKNIGGITYGDDLDVIYPYSGEIKNYYEDLWRQLPVVSKSICLVIALLDFKLQEEEIFDLASYLTRYPAEIDSSYIKIKHLIKSSLSGVGVYHNSFLVFLLNQPELVRQKIPLFKQMRIWLKKSSNEELKWSELVKIEHYLGNDKPLFSIDRNWVIDSFLNCRDQSQIEKILDLAVEAAFQKEDYQKVIYYRTLESYFSNKQFSFFETLDKIWITSFGLRKNISIRYPDFAKLNHAQIKEILLELKAKGQVHIVPEEVVDRFNDLLRDRDYDHHSIIKNWIEILAAFESRTVKDVYQFIVQARSNGSASSHFIKYCAILLDQNEDSKILELLSFTFEKREKIAIAECLMKHDLQLNRFHWKNQIKKLTTRQELTNLSQFYFLLADGIIPKKTQLSKYAEFPNKIEYHSIRDGEVVDLYIDNFFKAILLSYSQKQNIVEAWIENSPSSWPLNLMTAAFKTAIYLGELIISKERCNLKNVLSFFDELRALDFYDDHDIYELRRVIIPELIKSVLQLQTFINIHNEHASNISKTDCTLLLKNKWLYRDNWVELFSGKMIFLSDAAFSEFRMHETKKLHTEIIPFKDKAERLANLAILAKQLNKNTAADRLNREAANCIISYGNHKDMTLYSIMRSVEICGEAKSPRTNSYLKKIAPFIYHIEQLTDGDETGSFLYDYGQLLAKFNPNLCYNLYFEAVQKRDYNFEEILFGDILQTLNPSDPVDNAIANTAIDKNSYNLLIFLSEQNDKFRKVTENIQQTFGPIDYTETRDDQSQYRSKPDPKSKRDYLKISPEKLPECVEKIEGSNYFQRTHEKSKFILGWASEWLTRKGGSQYEIIVLLRELFEDRFSELDAELLDFIYPYALKIDRDFAFLCITWAQANSSSWSEEYIRRMDESRKRWLIVIKEFPRRKDEFFRKSINYSGWRRHRNSNSYFIPIPKATQFFIDCNRLDVAEKFTEYYIDTLEILFPNLKVDVPAFITQEREVSHFDILLQRLQSLSSLVRERAGWYLADLLKKDRLGDIHSKFFKWVKSQKLETFLCNGLMVIVKSLSDKESCSFKHINISALASEFRLRCMMSDLLTAKIAKLLNQRLDIQIPCVLTMSYSEPDVPEQKFYQLLGTYLPLAYQDYLNNLQEKSSFSIWKLWYNMFKDECENLNLVEQRSDKDYANDKREFMIARTTIFTDILRSTFFRIVDYLKETWILEMDDVFYYTVKNFQVDVSFWEIPLSQKPKWWPRFKNFPDIQIDLEEIEIDNDLEKIINVTKNEQVLHLSGAISSGTRHYEDKLEGKIHLLPFAFEKGRKPMNAEAIYENILSKSGLWIPANFRYTDFGLFENNLKFSNPDNQIFVDEVEITPLVSSVFHLNPHMWQYFRWAHEFRILGPDLANNISFSVSKGGISYMQKNKVVAQLLDFADGVRDRARHNSVIPAGNYIKIKKDYLDKFLTTNNFQLAYVVKSHYSVREYSYSDEVKIINSYRILNNF